MAPSSLRPKPFVLGPSHPQCLRKPFSALGPHIYRVCRDSDSDLDQGERTERRAPRGESRRASLLLFISSVTSSFLSLNVKPERAQALGFKKELKKRKVSLEEYADGPEGLKYFDIVVGNGKEVDRGAKVTAHFDCLYRGLDVVSTRSARLLGGNRTIAEPIEFIAGETLAATAAPKLDGDSPAGGLFSGASGPRPPPALSIAVLGMKAGGKRSVMVPPELGYGAQGEQEIGPNQTFELQIEVLDAE